MERLQVVVFRLINIAADILILSLAFGLGCYTRYHIQFDSPDLLSKFDEQSILIWYLIFYLSNFFFLAYFKVYHRTRLYPIINMARTYAKCCIFAFVTSIIVSFVYPYFPTSRLLLISATIYSWVFLLVKEYFVRVWIKNLRASGKFSRPGLVIGSDNEMINTIIKESLEDHLLSIDIKGVVITHNDQENCEYSVPILGSIDELEKIVENNSIATTIFASDRTDERLESAMWLCEERGVEVWYRMALLDRVISRATIEYLHEVPFLNLRLEPENGAALLVKHAFDRTFAGILLIFLSPLLLLLGLVVKLTSPGPILFKQTRSGLNGKEFNMYKFRSMVIDVDAQRENLLTKNSMNGPTFKLETDPRITRVGKFLRKFSLDELPQLWNVLRGEMSLVGPRPLRIEEARLTRSWQKRRLSMKPGLTCIWQISGRSNVADFDTWVKMDLDYIQNWSLWLDFVILLKTIPMVVVGRGAR